MDMLSRRDLMGAAALAASGVVVSGLAAQAQADQHQDAPMSQPTTQPNAHPAAPAIELPKLPYAYDALEPHVDAATMEIHHSKHHQAYVTGLNNALAGLAKARAAKDATNIQQLHRLVAFHGGGHVNHSVFWQNMAPAGQGGEPSKALVARLERDFGSVAAFLQQFSDAAVAVEGNGWAALTWHPMLGQALVLTLMNQQDLQIIGAVPLLMIDVWEHAYYLKHQNKRAAYVQAFAKVIHWADVSQRYHQAAGVS